MNRRVTKLQIGQKQKAGNFSSLLLFKDVEDLVLHKSFEIINSASD